ncbi:MAG: MGMT family protein [Candidatus Dormibacteraeota bacterium]|nr:MGMT family protein [Candidatus Dormibacteraeota bacterium]
MPRRARPRARPTATGDLGSAVAAVLAATHPGEVFTYSQVAALAGRPGSARAVGRVLANSSGLPWWRVMTASGRLVPGLEVEQAALLRAEGVAAEPRQGPQHPLRSKLPR